MHLYINTQKFCCIGSTLEIELYRKKNAQDNKLRKRLGTHSKQSIRFVQLWGENFPHNKWLFFFWRVKERKKNELFEWRLEGTNLFNAVVRAPCLLSIRIKGAGRGRYWIDKDTHWRWMLYIKERKGKGRGVSTRHWQLYLMAIGILGMLFPLCDWHVRETNSLYIPESFLLSWPKKKETLGDWGRTRLGHLFFFFVEENLLKRRLGEERERERGRRWTAVVAI